MELKGCIYRILFELHFISKVTLLYFEKTYTLRIYTKDVDGRLKLY